MIIILEIGNLYYILYLVISIIVFLSLYYILKDKSIDTQTKILQGILFFNLILHFSKLLFLPYRDGLPKTIRKVTFENICAVSTLVFPFIFLGKKKNSVLKNYMFFIGCLGGGLALLIPTEAINKKPFIFDTIRFYTCHFILIAVPLLSAIFRIIEVDYKKCFLVATCFIAVETIILVNEIILIKVGFVECENRAQFLDCNYRNNSFVFGPLDSFKDVGKALTIFTPKILKTDYFGLNNGIDFYFPVLWLIIPTYIYFPIIDVIIGLPFTHKAIKKDILSLKGRLKKC